LSYRPIADTWILARSKVKYYGAYPAGSLIRMRDLLGVGIDDPVLHVCSGHIRKYPYRGLGKRDQLLDLDGDCKPHWLRDAREPFPWNCPTYSKSTKANTEQHDKCDLCRPWDAILCDPPYTEADAEKYGPGSKVLPSARRLLTNGIAAVRVGGKVGILHYVAPRPDRTRARFVALATVFVGFENRPRLYSVYERIK
jgi:hypothetical protein